MVLKRHQSSQSAQNWFENDVKMYGTQTFCLLYSSSRLFENDVKMYGTQTFRAGVSAAERFENDVKMYGTQTLSLFQDLPFGLRMM